MKVYLVTGGTGTIGRALTLRLLSLGHKVRVYARNEHRHDALEREVPKEWRSRLSCMVGDVRDLRRLCRAAKGADSIIHAAAMKVITRVEYDPVEAVKTNILGTINTIEAALDTGVKRAILISTDKACSPANLYGATKMAAERLWINANRYCGESEGVFAAVRYGNVFGSQGSVFHVFQKQRQTGEVTITDPEMTRFHIQQEQAVDFVLAAEESAFPGEIWVPKLPSYLVTDVAKVMATDCTQNIIGRRPGEKLHEAMISEMESCYVSEHADKYVIDFQRVVDPGGWTYNSLTNERKLSCSEIHKAAQSLSKSS